MNNTVQRIAILVSLLWLCSPGWAQENAAGKLDFDIQAQTVERALNEFAQVTGLQLIFPGAGRGGKFYGARCVGETAGGDGAGV
jgi:hypothetical protein